MFHSSLELILHLSHQVNIEKDFFLQFLHIDRLQEITFKAFLFMPLLPLSLLISTQDGFVVFITAIEFIIFLTFS